MFLKYFLGVPQKTSTFLQNPTKLGWSDEFFSLNFGLLFGKLLLVRKFLVQNSKFWGKGKIFA